MEIKHKRPAPEASHGEEGVKPYTQTGRSLGIAKVPNLRDLGGYKTSDGGTITRGLVPRSNQLYEISPGDMEKLAALNLKNAYDLLTVAERKAHPEELPSGVNYVCLRVLADLPQAGPAQIEKLTQNPKDANDTLGGGTCCSPEQIPWGAMDQREVEKRSDVLVYTTEPFQQDFRVAGPVEVHLFAATSARDTDWTAKLVDVDPQGFAMNLTDGILRARYRQSFTRPELLQPGKAYEFVIDAGNTCMTFLKGHRLRLEISSSNFPHYSRNTNTGNVPEKDVTFSVAHQTVYHDQARASYLQVDVK